MAKNKKPLLNEGTVRRMMKLANMDALGDGFINEKWTGEKAGDEGAGKDKDDTDYSGKGMRKGDESDTGRGKDDINEQEEELGFEEEEIEDVEAAPEEAPEEVAEEVTITDEEAQDIIDLADKLRDAVGGEEEEELPPEEEIEMGAEEEEIGLEEPGTHGGLYEDELYEAALRGLSLDLVDDRQQKRNAMLQEVKSRVYKRVVNRLLKETSKK
tara:strand:- start:156 stop:794 length:639 start_codon:yes stop_codon:yes gene_type:complete